MEKEKRTISLKKMKNNFLTDVETCNDQRIVMELSYLVVNKLFGKKQEKCFIIKEVWENEEYRNGKYAKEKLEHWQEMLDNGTAKLISIYELYKIINKTIEEENIETFSAYNANFDYNAILKTYHRYGLDKRKDYEKENKLLNLDLMCLWNYATKIYCSKEYVEWAIENKKFTPKGKIQSNAESIYQYLIENKFFVETHFGIEDLQIEYTILIASVIQNTMDRNNKIVLNQNGSWTTIEKFRKEIEVV